MIFFKNIFLFTFQASSVDDNAVLDDFSYDSQASNLSQASNTPVLKKRKGTSRALSTASPTPSSVSKTSDTNLKEMAVDALRAMSVPQQKDKFGAFADYIAAELRSLTILHYRFTRINAFTHLIFVHTVFFLVVVGFNNQKILIEYFSKRMIDFIE